MIGPRIGETIGPRIGTRIGLVRDGSVTTDATSGKGVPATAAEFASLGWTASNLWLFQMASGNASDSIGAVTLTAAGSIGYQTAVTGWTRTATTFTAEGGASVFSTTSIHDNAASSGLLLAYVRLTATPGATRDVMGFGSGTDYRFANVTVAPVYQAAENGGGTTAGASNPGTSVRPVIVQVNRSESRFSVITDQEVVTEGWTNPAGGGSLLGIGGMIGGVAPMEILYAAFFSGAAAEKTTAQIKTLLQTLGWTVAW